jgi:hypothetical protein
MGSRFDRYFAEELPKRLAPGERVLCSALGTRMARPLWKRMLKLDRTFCYVALTDRRILLEAVDGTRALEEIAFAQLVRVSALGFPWDKLVALHYRSGEIDRLHVPAFPGSDPRQRDFLDRFAALVHARLPGTGVAPVSEPHRPP